jgi:hypothetical protein
MLSTVAILKRLLTDRRIPVATWLAKRWSGEMMSILSPQTCLTKTAWALVPMLLLMTLTVAEAAEQTTAIPAAGTPYERLHLDTAMSKALTFETTSSVAESLVFVAVYGTATTSLAAFFAVSLVSATAVYVVHEYAWDAFNQGTIPANDPRLITAKATSYRVASATRSFTAGALLGGAAALITSAGFALAVAVADTALYVGNEFWFSTSDNPSTPTVPAVATPANT